MPDVTSDWTVLKLLPSCPPEISVLYHCVFMHLGDVFMWLARLESVVKMSLFVSFRDVIVRFSFQIAISWKVVFTRNGNSPAIELNSRGIQFLRIKIFKPWQSLNGRDKNQRKETCQMSQFPEKGEVKDAFECNVWSVRCPRSDTLFYSIHCH